MGGRAAQAHFGQRCTVCGCLCQRRYIASGRAAARPSQGARSSDHNCQSKQAHCRETIALPLKRQAGQLTCGCRARA